MATDMKPDADEAAAWWLQRMEQLEMLMAEAVLLILQQEQAPEEAPRTLQRRQEAAEGAPWAPQRRQTAGRAPRNPQRRQMAETTPRTPQRRQTAETVLLNCQRRQTAAWEPQSAGLAHLSLQQEQVQDQKVLGPLAERIAYQTAKCEADQVAE